MCVLCANKDGTQLCFTENKTMIEPSHHMSKVVLKRDALTIAAMRRRIEYELD